jgi:hypothetical protein
MQRHLLRTLLGITLLLGLAAPWLAHAAVRGMITRVRGEQIVVNMGLDKNVRPGTMLYVYDGGGHPLGQVRVTQVDDYSSEVAIIRLEPQASLVVGSSVTDTPYTPADLPLASKPTGASTPPATSAPGDTVALVPPTPTAKPVDPVKQFESVLRRRTQTYAFRGGKGGSIKVEPSDALNLMSTVIGVGRGSSMSVNPWLLSSTAYDQWQRYSTTSTMNQKARTTLEVVYWDEVLTNAYADYYVYKETYLDAARKQEMRQSLLSQKGINTSAVFQVRIRNRGPGVLQISPFDWHFYMLDTDGNRVKAERYDEVLDKALNVGQDAQGYVYFPKRDPLGRSYVPEPVKILVEDVFGERTTIVWTTKLPAESTSSSRDRDRRDKDGDDL